MVPASAFARFKREPLVMATGYDFAFARILEEAGVDVILVGDSLANVMLGLKTTREVDMDIMSVFVGAVGRGAKGTHIMADMPYGSDSEPRLAVANAKRFLALGAHSVKLEGPKFEVVKALASEGVPVMGHIGLLPQTAKSFKQVGREREDRDEVLRAAEGLVAAGAMSLLLEHMASDLAADITRRFAVPTVGIGAGPDVDGQVLVLHDFLGMHSGNYPPFAHAFADLHGAALAGAKLYCRAVRTRAFPEG
jgi:3-methyl-2-oxobutanoate hydroxymethyltransferase